jgi:hypothetical protein
MISRKRSSTSAFLGDIVRDRRFTKLSKGTERTKESAMKMESVELDVGSSINQMREIVGISEGLIPK